ncbi:MAG: isocitrate lyase/PEP mutase family protein [Saprospiraceae bacterium]|nr:isocitrate lyase/PEP mutase family protein [Saprospiraceae bacterium]
MTENTIRSLVARQRPLLLPVAHDALSAHLIESAGFQAYSIGGFGLIGCRYRLPDIGLASFGEMAAGVREIMMGSSIPVLVDADDGYGDIKNTARTVEVYEVMGVSGIILEDQVSPKRCGHMAGKSVVAAEAAVKKLKVALASRQSKDFFIVARTDALSVHGIEEAIRRGRMYAEAGADAVFVEAPASRQEIETIAADLSGEVPLVINMAEAGRTPILPAEELAEIGYSIIAYPSTLLLRVIAGIRDGLQAIADQEFGQQSQMSLGEFAQIFGIDKWNALEDRFRGRDA